MTGMFLAHIGFESNSQVRKDRQASCYINWIWKNIRKKNCKMNLELVRDGSREMKRKKSIDDP